MPAKQTEAATTVAVHDPERGCWFIGDKIPGSRSKAQRFALVDFEAEQRRGQVIALHTEGVNIATTLRNIVESARAEQSKGATLTADDVLARFDDLLVDSDRLERKAGHA